MIPNEGQEIFQMSFFTLKSKFVLKMDNQEQYYHIKRYLVKMV